jgi:hypothetical protein
VALVELYYNMSICADVMIWNATRKDLRTENGGVAVHFGNNKISVETYLQGNTAERVDVTTGADGRDIVFVLVIMYAVQLSVSPTHRTTDGGIEI